MLHAILDQPLLIISVYLNALANVTVRHFKVVGVVSSRGLFFLSELKRKTLFFFLTE